GTRAVDRARRAVRQRAADLSAPRGHRGRRRSGDRDDRGGGAGGLRVTDRVPMLVGGRLVESRSEEVEPIPDPATGETIALLPHSTTDEISRAIESARDAFPAWSETPVPDRAAVMFRFRAILEIGRASCRGRVSRDRTD